MRHTYVYIAALIALSTAHAKLIDLTPGGTVIDYGPPPFIAANGFYDEAEALPYTIYDPNVVYPPGWVSQFGILNGGQYFFTDLFTHSLAPTASVSWNFGNSGHWLLYIDVFGFDQTTGADLANLYQVTGASAFKGQDILTLNGQMDITSISFYGRNPALPIPDQQGTFGLLLLALGGIAVARRICLVHDPVSVKHNTRGR